MTRSFLFILLICWLQPVMGQAVGTGHVAGNAHPVARARDLVVDWPAGGRRTGRLVLSMKKDSSLIRSLSIVKDGITLNVARDIDPTFLLRVGRRDLISQNGWNIFFDKVPLKGYRNYEVTL